MLALHDVIRCYVAELVAVITESRVFSHTSGISVPVPVEFTKGLLDESDLVMELVLLRLMILPAFSFVLVCFWKNVFKADCCESITLSNFTFLSS